MIIHMDNILVDFIEVKQSILINKFNYLHNSMYKDNQI